LLEHLVYIN